LASRTQEKRASAASASFKSAGAAQTPCNLLARLRVILASLGRFRARPAGGGFFIFCFFSIGSFLLTSKHLRFSPAISRNCFSSITTIHHFIT
jgi:hypothetical protein